MAYIYQIASYITLKVVRLVGWLVAW